MPDKKEIILPLYQLFQQLQAYEKKLKHQSLSTDSYLDLIDVLKKGYGLISIQDLYFLVKMLWFKPHLDENKFKGYFETYLAPFQIADKKGGKDATDPSEEEESSQKPATEPSDESQKTEKKKEEEKIKEDPVEEKEEKEDAEKTFETVTLRFNQATAQQAQFLATDLITLEQNIYAQPYRLSGQYYPVEKRTIQQNIRSLRILTDKTKDMDIDWEGTIDRVANHGYFDRLEMKRIPEISNQLCILIDNGGSMVAFHQLAEEIALEVKKLQLAGTTQVYYFRNCPVNYLYKDDIHTEAVPLAMFAANIDHPIFIISDAGAARGRFDRDYIQQSKEFLKHLANKRVAWLNPMPRERWQDNSAAFIAQEVPMFAINPQELGNAIKLFKQKK